MAQGRQGQDTRTTRTPASVPPTESGARADTKGESQDPQLRKVHAVAGSDDELGRGNDVPVEQGGARHRQQ